MNFSNLDIENPQFLKSLSYRELEQLATQIRKFILEILSLKGGHLSSNLGIVELTMALHRNFNAPEDKIFFDVGHQCYTHKILTGRTKDFFNLRDFEGLSGFQKRSESIYDCFEAGHASTSISASVGMAIARDLSGQNYHIVPVIGDASIVSGLSFEALNHLGSIKSKVIIVLNDNEMAISKSIGGFSKVLAKTRTSRKYLGMKSKIKAILSKIPLIGKVIIILISLIKKIIKRLLVKENIFDNLNLGYSGPIDGHNFKELDQAFKNAKSYPGSIVVHVMTHKGKGYQFSESDDKGSWHGVSPFKKETGESLNDSINSWSEVFADYMEVKMQNNPKIIAITPAMIIGSKLEKIFTNFSERAIDVGIAEEHAFTMAAGLSLAGMKPFIAIYSSFMQRSYDQIVHDVVRMKLPMIIAVDRAGIVGQDGETHQGIFDAAFLNDLPDVIISMAKDNQELKTLIDLAEESTLPFFIRLPRTTAFLSNETCDFKVGKWQIYPIKASKGYLISYGPVINDLIKVAQKNNLTLINARFIKPLDERMLMEIAKDSRKIFIYDLYGTYQGLTAGISKFYQTGKINVDILPLTLPSIFIQQGSIKEMESFLEVNILSLQKFIQENLK